MTVPLPPGWSYVDYSSWVDPILADCAAERTEWIYARTPGELRLNVEQWLATGSTSAPLPTAWTMAEFTEWVTRLIADADAAYDSDVLSKIPYELLALTDSYIDAASPADQWAAAVVANGGVVSPARKSAVQTFIAAEMASGTWALTDDYWCFWAENPIQALTSIKQRRLAVAVNAPVFLPNRHYEFDGVANYINTGFVPSTHAVALTGSEQRLGVYERANVSGNTTSIGAYTAGPGNLYVRARSATVAYASFNTTAAASFTLPAPADGRGFTASSRAGGGTTVRGFKNGVALTDATGLTVTNNTLQAHALAIGASNTGGTINLFRAAPIGFACVGAPLTNQQEKDQFDNIQSWAIAVGAASVGQDDVTLWANAVIGRGGTVSTTRRALMTNFVDALKAASIWNLVDDAWMLVAENPTQALVSLKQRRLATAVNAPAFTADQGYAFAGTSYVDTGFVPSVNAVAMTGISLHLAAYERTNIATGGNAAGSVIASTANLLIIPRLTSGLLSVQLNSQAVGPGGDVLTDSRGLSVGSRNGTLTADVLAYKNGVAVLPNTPGTVGSSLPTVKLFIGAQCNSSSVAVSFRAATEGFVSVGAAIPAASQPAFYNAVQSFMAALGAEFVPPLPSDPDVTAWAAQVVTNGGTVSPARVELVRVMVAAWKSASIWPLIDDAWLLVAENPQQALTSLKQRRLATAVNSPAFTVDRGYMFGSSSSLDTGFIPSTHGVAITGTNMHISTYERTNVASTSAAAGCLNTNSQSLVILPRRTDSIMGVQLNSLSSGPGGGAVSDSRGLSVGSRNGTLAADVLAYKNGVAIAPFAPGALGSALTTSKLYIGCRADATNVAGSFRSASQGFVSAGAAIPAGQQPAFYNAIQTLMTAVGANV